MVWLEPECFVEVREGAGVVAFHPVGSAPIAVRPRGSAVAADDLAARSNCEVVIPRLHAILLRARQRDRRCKAQTDGAACDQTDKVPHLLLPESTASS